MSSFLPDPELLVRLCASTMLLDEFLAQSAEVMARLARTFEEMERRDVELRGPEFEAAVDRWLRDHPDHGWFDAMAALEEDL